MDEQRAWIRSRRKKRLRFIAVALCFCLLVTSYPDILATLSAFATEQGDGTVYVSGFAELPEAVREQTVPLGTEQGELSLPDALEVFANTESMNPPEETDQPGDPEEGNEEKPEKPEGEEEQQPEKPEGEEEKQPEKPEEDGITPPDDGIVKPEDDDIEQPAEEEKDDIEKPDAEQEEENNDAEPELLSVRSGVFVMPVYMAEPEVTVEPQTLERKEETVMIKGVTWQSEPEYDGNTEGTYIFTAVLPEGYALTEGVSLPQIAVTVLDEAAVQALIERIAALPDVQEYMEEEPDIDDWKGDEDAYEEAYEEWMEGLSVYVEEALAIWEAYEVLTAEQQAQIPEEALQKLTAWVEIAEKFAGSRKVMTAAVGWTVIEGSNLQWKLDSGTLTISGSGAMPAFTRQGAPWYSEKANIKRVVIESGVTSIGNYAFQDCESVTSVTIPSSVTSIGECAFLYCRSVTSAAIPSSVTSIGDSAFLGCQALTSVTIPNEVKKIDSNTFNNCVRLTSVTIPEGVTSIGRAAFNGCRSLTSVTIPSSVTSIGDLAFVDCSSLTTVTFTGQNPIPALVGASFKNCPCVEGDTKGISIPTCKYLTVSGWQQYKDHVNKSHTMKKVAAEDATCVATGISEHWKCTACNSLFSDADGTTNTTLTAVTTAILAHNYTYSASGAVITEKCNLGCDHSATATLSIQNVNQTYTGSAIKPVIVTYGTGWAGSKPAVSYTDNIDVGTATATLTISGATASLTFTISPAAMSGVSATGYTGAYDAAAHGITVTAPTGATVKYGTTSGSYTRTTSPTYANVGTNTVYYQVTKDNYTAVTGSEQVKITACDIKNATVTLGSSLTYSGAEQTQTVASVKVGDRTVPAGDYTISDNKKTDAGTYTLTITGKGNHTGTVTKQFTIARCDISGAVVTLGTGLTYSGAEQTQTVTSVTLNGKALTKDTDYAISSNTGTKAGTYTLTITGKGNYTGTVTKQFTIAGKTLTSSMVTLAANSYDHTGEEIEPAVTVKDGNKILVSGTDYTVSYTNNTNIGTNAAVTVTGKGNYTGTVEVKFVIRNDSVAPPDIKEDDLDIGYEGGTIALPDDIKDKVEIYTDPDDPEGSMITPNPDGSLPVEPGDTIYIRYKETDEANPASEGIKIEIPGRPAAPEPVEKEEITVTDTAITVPKPDDGKEYEYVLVEKGEEPDWSKANETGEFTDLDPNREYDLYVREKATEDSFASEPAKTEIKTPVTIKEPVIEGENADKPGNTVATPDAPDEDGGSVTYTGTCGEDYTPVIIVDGEEITPEITWDEDGKTGTWTYTVPVEDGKPDVEIAVEFKNRKRTGVKVTPDTLSIYADDNANKSESALLDYLKANCVLKAEYDNHTSDVVTTGADYTTKTGFEQKGATYVYTVEAGGDSTEITLTVNPVTADIKAPDARAQRLKTGGYTEAEVEDWLPETVAVTYKGSTTRTENVEVTWKTDSIGANFGAVIGNKTINGTVALPAWASGGNTVSIEVEFVDRNVLTDAQMKLSISGWAYGAQTAPAPQGSITVADTNQTFDYLYSAGDDRWGTAEDVLPKSESGNIIPGTYLVKMTYTGENYTGVKTASFTVGQKPVTVGKGTLVVENRNYDGTTNATLKEGGKPGLSGVITGDDVAVGGTLSAVFANMGPKKDIDVNVSGFELTGDDKNYYKLANTTITLKATINNADGTAPSSGSSSGNSGGSSSSGSSGNSGSNGDNDNSGDNGNSGESGNSGNSGSGDSGNSGESSNGGSNVSGNSGSAGSAGTGTTTGGSGGSGSTGGTGKGGTGSGSTGGTGKGGTGSGSTGGTGKRSTESGSTNGSGGSNGNGSSGNGTGAGSTDVSGQDGTSQAGSGQQAENETVQIVQAAAEDGRIVVDGTGSGDGSGAGSGDSAYGGKIITGNVPGMADAGTAPKTSTVLAVGEGAVIVTVVCEEQKYTAGVADTTAVANAVLTPEQIQHINDGGTIEVRVDVKDISDSISLQDMKTVEKGYEAYGQYLTDLKLGGYVDISVYIKTGDSGWNAVTETGEPIEVVIGIPEELRGDGREYYVIRAHEGRHDLLNDMDDVQDTITVITDMFSSYVIAYRLTGTVYSEADTVYGGVDIVDGRAVCRLCHICPTFHGVCCFIWLVIIVAVAALAGLILYLGYFCIVYHRGQRYSNKKFS